MGCTGGSDGTASFPGGTLLAGAKVERHAWNAHPDFEGEKLVFGRRPEDTRNVRVCTSESDHRTVKNELNSEYRTKSFAIGLE